MQDSSFDSKDFSWNRCKDEDILHQAEIRDEAHRSLIGQSFPSWAELSNHGSVRKPSFHPRKWAELPSRCAHGGFGFGVHATPSWPDPRARAGRGASGLCNGGLRGSGTHTTQLKCPGPGGGGPPAGTEPTSSCSWAYMFLLSSGQLEEWEANVGGWKWDCSCTPSAPSPPRSPQRRR